MPPPPARWVNRIHPAAWAVIVAVATLAVCAAGTLIAAHIGGLPLPVDGAAP